ncbi:hypothetical protein P792_00475 [Asaia sp. SF2.1]|nr:hypothetical protein P792_00475 [Asaia sp. SF2.1]
MCTLVQIERMLMILLLLIACPTPCPLFVYGRERAVFYFGHALLNIRAQHLR